MKSEGMKLQCSLDIDSIEKLKKRLKQFNSDVITPALDKLIKDCCIWIVDCSNEHLERSGMNEGIIKEIYNGWSEPKKVGKNRYILSNYGRGYSVEFGIGVVGEGTYDGDVPSNYEYDVDSGKKLDDGSWIFRINDLYTLDIMQKNVLPNKNGEVNYEKGRAIKTQGQEAIMFVYNAINDFANKKIVQKLWKTQTWGD